MDVKVKVVKNGSVVHAFPLGAHAVTIGRAPDNDLVLTSGQISSHHAVLFTDTTGVVVRDLQSTNGLWKDGRRVPEARLTPGEAVRLGDLELHLTPTTSAVPTTDLQLRQVDGPIAWNVESGFDLPGHSRHTLFVEATELLLMGPEGARSLALEEPFQVGADTFVLMRTPAVHATVPASDRFPYRLHVDLTKDRASMQADNLPDLVFRASNRVALLYVLADQAGRWVDDTVIGPGVWGRAWIRQDPNNLNVLLHRVRAQAAKAGYDKRFIDRRRGAMCIRVEETALT